MERALIFLCLIILGCAAQDWKSVKVKKLGIYRIPYFKQQKLTKFTELFQRARHNALKQSNNRLPEDFDTKLRHFASKKDEDHFFRVFNSILKVRVPGTEGSREVRNFIENQMTSLGWAVEEDQFNQNTVIGNVQFTNVIATLDPNAPR